ncbi:unnamed protein product [Rotaria sordida]|uniref:G-protein coupled receptors family 1 profile domain-containing protein n=1 Tax=Rotaria sordida TaxID=392033 RepID=A0A819MDA8_9BILA|nr:unnamed protein product [Rotaria sordida]CAF3978077.1 unnamed protein product [Rotaria sordida]
MATIFYHPSLFLSSSSSSSFHMSNQTSIDYSNSTNNYIVNLFIIIAVWIVLIITIVFGTTGNILVLYVYMNRNDNKTCTFFIKMLAFVDLIICLILAPLELYQTTTGIHNEFFCKVYGFLNTHVLYSTFLITTIAFDRYFCICWPLYKIITIHRARAIVAICGLLSSLLAIIPMSEYSTMDHILHIHNNHSEQLSVESYDEYDSPVYTHVENIKTSVLILPFTIGNITHVKCSPRFSLNLNLSNFLYIYRIFHGTLFALCMILVLILYSFIYNAVYRRRRTRTKKFSTYRKILQSYLTNNETEHEQINHNLSLRYICCYCCNKIHRKISKQSILHQSLNNQNKIKYFHRKQTSTMKKKSENIILELNSTCEKRYSAISMTSMTYFTSGVWDDTSPTNIIPSRINSIAAVSYCGMEHSSASRPSTSTEDSFDQITKNNNLSQIKSITPSNLTHLTVPKQQIILSSCSNETNKYNQLNDIDLQGNISQSKTLLQPPIVRKPSNTLSIRQQQQQRPSDASAHQRKVSFMTSRGITTDCCIIEDAPSTNQQISSTSSIINQQIIVNINNQRSLSTSSSIDPSVRDSISSKRRTSGFDGETKRVFERQQRQERLANIRTTFTLFIVTATFILMYLPSIIITLFNIKPYEFREVLFLLYYINSACNPLIYSFFNVNFRNDIRRIYECHKHIYFA